MSGHRIFLKTYICKELWWTFSILCVTGYSCLLGIETLTGMRVSEPPKTRTRIQSILQKTGRSESAWASESAHHSQFLSHSLWDAKHRLWDIPSSRPIALWSIKLPFEGKRKGTWASRKDFHRGGTECEVMGQWCPLTGLLWGSRQHCFILCDLYW